MKRYLPNSLAALALSAAVALPASAEVAKPSVREGDFFCFRGMPQEQINVLPGATSKARPMFRIDKLGNSKFDNTDGHDLREIPTSGYYPVLVILVEFQDVTLSRSWGEPQTVVNDMLNSPDFSFQGATGSANDYFQRVSQGQFNPRFNVVGPVKVSKTEKEYVTSNPQDTYVDPASGKNVTVYPAGRMVEEAIKALDDQIDFTQYDTDGDGFVDFVYLFFAGQGATTGGGSDRTIWPHAFTLTSAIGAPVEVDGVKVNRYCTSSELGSNRRLSGIGTFCHEFSHVLGLPDYYDTANNNGTASKCFSPGPYSNMDAGNYNNSEHTPPFFSIYEQYAMEWQKPASLSGTGNYTLLPVEARPFGYQVPTKNNPQEYFLLEARGNSFLDQYLPGHGLLVWHIDFDLGIWTNNTLNNVAAHQRVDIIEADNMLDATTRDGDLFPGTSGVCEFTKNVTPSFKDWKGNDVGYDLTEIGSYFDGTVSFNAKGSAQIASEAVIATPAIKVVGADANSIEVEWPALDNAEEYYISVFKASEFDGGLLPYNAYADGWYFRNLGKVAAENGVCSLTISDLPANTNYGIMLYAANSLNAARMKYPVFATTVDGEDFEAASTNLRLGADDGVAIAEWDTLEGADSYELMIVNREKGNITDTFDWDFSTGMIPANWTDNGTKYDNRKFATAAPSLSLQTPGAYLQSPIFDEPISEISFWAAKRYTDELCELEIYGLNKDGQPSFAYSLDNLQQAGSVFTLAMPVDTYGVKFVYIYRSTDLFCYIDDLKVEFTSGHVDTPATEADIEYGDYFASVKGLKDGVDYVAYVYPVKAGERGVKSNEIAFRMENLSPSGVEGIESEVAANVSFRTDGLTIFANDAETIYDVYSADGAVIARGVKGTTPVPARGIYLIRTAAKTLKVIL